VIISPQSTVHSPRSSDTSDRFERSSRHVSRFTFQRLNAFTLIEIMIVVGIMGVLVTLGVPLVYKIWHRAPMGQALRDVTEVCSNARREAILHGHQVDLVFHPREGRMEVAGGIGGQTPVPGAANTADFSTPPDPQAAPPPRSGYSAKLDETILIEMLDINKFPHDFRDDDIARVRFFPNGTCDEMTLILVSAHGERREIKLEVTTGLVEIESDPTKFH
jgi:prepilin-type N-terminal cleavage/methylation domain-containing protein